VKKNSVPLDHFPGAAAARVARSFGGQPDDWVFVENATAGLNAIVASMVFQPGDEIADPSKAWPAGRRTVEVGTLVVNKVIGEPDGPCRDINFDPTVLPRGMRVSDDPFPAARSSTYARSYDLRTSEAKDYPRTVGAGSTRP